MKIKPDDYASLKAAIDKTLHAFPCKREEYAAAGMSDTRFAWDLLHASKYPTGELYRYLNDSHITTALLHILKDATAAVNR